MKDLLVKKGKIHLLAKASADKKQIASRVNKGAESFEIQLMDDKFDSFKICDDICDVDVLSIHTPLIYKSKNLWEEICISDLNDKKTCKTLEKVGLLAQNIARIQKHNVLIVIHCDLSLYEVRKYNLCYLYKVFDTMISRYPDIILCLENISPIRTSPFRYNNGALFGAVEIAEWINNKFKVKKVGTVLDICHMQMLQYMLNFYINSEIYASFPQYNMSDFFEKYAPSLKLIHLNEAFKDGYGSRHGKVPTVETIKEVLKCCLKNECIPYFCLEVKERDYTECNNYIQAYNNFEKARSEILT